MYCLEEEAIHFVFQSFHGVNRVKENISVASHSIMVGVMLKNIGCSEQIVIAGYLHDILEDTSYDYAFLKVKFGEDIANLVLKVTENKTVLNWKERKQQFLTQLEQENSDVLLIELADKLQNLISDYSLYLKEGIEILNTEADGYDDIKWYYLSFKTLFNQKLEENDLLKRYNEITELYFH